MDDRDNTKIVLFTLIALFSLFMFLFLLSQALIIKAQQVQIDDLAKCNQVNTIKIVQLEKQIEQQERILKQDLLILQNKYK